MTTQSQELQAMIAELESQLADAPPDMREILRQQIDAARRADQMLIAALASAPQFARSALSPEMRAFFTPQPPAEVPSWVPDSVTRREVDDALMRCPADASVYAEEDSVGCAVPIAPGRIPIRHGLQLGFLRSTGRLQHQRFYERGLLRWAIEYHATGGRSSVGFYSDTEPRVHLEEGVETWFAPNGTVTAQSTWRAGVKQGWTRLWEDDGTPVTATRYEDGRPVESIMADGTPLPTS
ncbi:MAG: hypothetical protein HYY06_15020 [Deltaproteobacteria bacterium]|nr:hypothetical protein [Deltaproteobacteria bacterium]